MGKAKLDDDLDEYFAQKDKKAAEKASEVEAPAAVAEAAAEGEGEGEIMVS